jgi:flagellar biosynthesis protein FlhA
MDGASKFVRGDAVAGILILFINIIGGFAIGTLQHNLDAGTAAQNYVLLTIGDGLVAQIPSMLLSTATAIIVTRMSSEQDMSAEVTRQLTARYAQLGFLIFCAFAWGGGFSQAAVPGGRRDR